MYAENMPNIDEDFFNALALLHSTEENSTEKLRRMLDACIEKKYGPGKTLAARMPKRFLRNVELRDDSVATKRISRKREYEQGRATKSEVCDGFGTVSLLEADAVENVIASDRTVDVHEVFKINYEACSNDEEVPRISIPDEGSVDGNTTLCKICNGGKLGPLILLECQECQESYHPLCHQPPVVDVDVYDPRFVWRCRRCIDASSVISSKDKVAEKGSIRKVRRTGDVVKENRNALKTGKKHGVSSGKKNSVESRSVQLRDSPLFAKDIANVSQRNGNLSSSMQSSRKRIGSKLSVVRAPIK